MLKFFNFDIVCQEIPDEMTLAVNITSCPIHCPGCHSKWLWEDVGDVLDRNAIDVLIGRYGSSITCFCFMGGDNEPASVGELAGYLKQKYPHLATGWYSGRSELPENFPIENMDYLKLGPYIEEAGGLKSPSTNQRLYRIKDGIFTEIKLTK